MKKCEQCDKSFATPQGLAVHVARMHKSVLVTTNTPAGKGTAALLNGNHRMPALERHREEEVVAQVATAQRPKPAKRTFAMRCCPNCACPLDGVAAAMELANENA
jgi:hypothetical protein